MLYNATQITPIIPCLQSQYCSRRQRKGGGGGQSWCLQGAGEVILLLYMQYCTALYTTDPIFTVLCFLKVYYCMLSLSPN